MSLSEFELIARYFSPASDRADVILGVGDDAALVRVSNGMELAVSVDTLVAGVHFSLDTPAAAIGHKALAVNLSDLAAMGAQAAWFTLALTLPEADEAWLEQFSTGLLRLADRHGVALIGGDTCRGPLSISIQVLGQVPAGQALRRDGARPGDVICVTGELGSGGVGLAVCQQRLDWPLTVGERNHFIQRLERPQPRLAAGQALRGLASAAIDVSDGLAADLGHILSRSGVGARVDLASLPVAAAVRIHGGDDWWHWPLHSGDDYELCFTVPPARYQELMRRLDELGCSCSRIGEIRAEPGLKLNGLHGLIDAPVKGYRHFQ